jgi:hypothetical protein
LFGVEQHPVVSAKINGVRVLEQVSEQKGNTHGSLNLREARILATEEVELHGPSALPESNGNGCGAAVGNVTAIAPAKIEKALAEHGSSKRRHLSG